MIFHVIHCTKSWFDSKYYCLSRRCFLIFHVIPRMQFSRKLRNSITSKRIKDEILGIFIDKRILCVLGYYKVNASIARSNIKASNDQHRYNRPCSSRKVHGGESNLERSHSSLQKWAGAKHHHQAGWVSSEIHPHHLLLMISEHDFCFCLRIFVLSPITLLSLSCLWFTCWIF